ncbi:uncharacterized protein LOC131257544 [Magnolia sinica]|uniref:uncharacterized protein LOC131257544 n=1 Tax=Magnolia sinica TaxID=86752 RepID=UPI00265AF296|nr:uncharacterized protein LOC131257544 [Magnolia sinica]
MKISLLPFLFLISCFLAHLIFAHKYVGPPKDDGRHLQQGLNATVGLNGGGLGEELPIRRSQKREAGGVRGGGGGGALKHPQDHKRHSGAFTVLKLQAFDSSDAMLTTIVMILMYGLLPFF